MKKGLAFLLLLVMSTSLRANELSWLSNYGEALNLARTTGRPLLLVISRDDHLPTASDRLSPFHAARRSSDVLNAYVLCKIDANSGYGKRVAKAFSVSEFPHAVIIDKTTKQILCRIAGQATDEAWKVTLAKYQDGATRQEVTVTQPQATVQGQRQMTVRGQSQATVQSQSQATVQSQSQAYGQTYFFRQSAYFRQPANCNT